MDPSTPAELIELRSELARLRRERHELLASFRTLAWRVGPGDAAQLEGAVIGIIFVDAGGTLELRGCTVGKVVRA